MKQKIKTVIFFIIVLAGLVFILVSFKRSSAPPLMAADADLRASAVRVYGTVEPEGREVFVSPPFSRRVTEIYVKEGDRVKKGQRLCDLESSVEEKEADLAKARVALAQKSLILTKDDLDRTKKLFKTRVNSEFQFTQAKIKYELDLKRITVANSELDLAKAKREQTILRSPIDGHLYKFDIRKGETLSQNDADRIILGSEKLWVRLSVESFWRDRLKLGTECIIYDTETNKKLGTGKVLYKLPYMGRRDFRTEDMQERFDTKFQQFIVAFQPEVLEIPIGLSVVAHVN